MLKLSKSELQNSFLPGDDFFFVLPGYEMSEADGITAIQKQLTTLPKPNYTLLMYLW